MNGFSAIKNTGQWWKALVSFWVVVLGGLFMNAGIYQIRSSKGTGILFLPLGSLVAFIGGLFACIFVRCPSCKAPWVWIAISKKSPTEWFPWLKALEQCPECGGEDIYPRAPADLLHAARSANALSPNIMSQQQNPRIENDID
jgi:hypothetical protein